MLVGGVAGPVARRIERFARQQALRRNVFGQRRVDGALPVVAAHLLGDHRRSFQQRRRRGGGRRSREDARVEDFRLCRNLAGRLRRQVEHDGRSGKDIGARANIREDLPLPVGSLDSDARCAGEYIQNVFALPGLCRILLTFFQLQAGKVKKTQNPRLDDLLKSPSLEL